MSELPKTERDKKCLACGSEEHRARDCKAGKAKQDSTAQPSTPTPQAADPIRESDSAAVSSTSSASQPIVPATPVNASMVEFVQEALRAIRQVEANERAEVSVKASGGDAARNPSMQSLTIHCPTCVPTNSPNSQPEGVNVFGLVDSGATHPLRPASSQEEWLEAEQVEVGLAGGHASHMRITKHGVILTPPGRDGLPAAIVPLGQLVTRLGYMLSWTTDECFLRSPEGELTTLRVQNGCPVIEHDDRALTLIAELEAQRENARSTFANRAANEVSSTLVIAKALQAFGLPLGGQDEHVSPSLKPGWGHGISAQMTAPIWPGQTPLLEPKKGVCGTQVLDPKVCLQQSSTVWLRLDADDECDDKPTRYQLDGDGDSSVYDLDWTRLPLSPLGRDGPAQVPGPLPCCPGRCSLDGFGGFCVSGLREVQPTNRQDLATRPGGEHETTVPSSVAVPATSPREGGTRNARQRLPANLLFQLLLLCLLLLGVRGAVFAPCPGVRNPPAAAASGAPVPCWVEEEQCVRLWGLSGVVPEPPVQEESQQPLAERVLLTTVRLAAAADGLVRAVCWGMPGVYLFRKRDHPVCAVFMLFVFLQVVGAASQQDEEPEDMLLPVPLDADLMLAVCIFGIAFCAIGLWEFLKWGFAFLSRRAFGASSVSLSPRKARKLQRLRDRTEQAIRAEISERESAASSSQRLATASGRNAPASTRQADEATRFFATPEGNKLHRTKACSTLAHSRKLVVFEVCQQCHRSQADCIQHSAR